MSRLQKNGWLLISSRKYHYLRSQLFIPSVTKIEREKKKEDTSAVTKSISSRILENNGFIAGSANGLTTFLPLGKRVLNKAITIIREEMNRIGGQEISMSSLSDLSLWKKTERDTIIGSELFKLTDRKNRELCLCPTHEEIVTSLVSQFSKSINSKVLGENQALLLYQITPKYRDEPQPKHGLLRSREFLMKDMYTFHLSENCARTTYDNVCKAYESVWNRLDLKYIKAEASVGSMGGSMSHEYQIESPIGEDVIYHCKECNKAISSDLVDDKSVKSICSLVKCDRKAEMNKKNCIEIGHTFILGDRYTKVFPIHSETGKQVIMGCYGIGVSRIIQATIEQYQQNELYPNWPFQITPFQIAIIPPKTGSSEEVPAKQLLEKLLSQFSTQPTLKDEILVDDRTANSIGSRLIDAKLIGASYILVLGKSIKENKLEIIINSTSIQNILKKVTVTCSIDDALNTINHLNDEYFKVKNYF